MTLQDWDDNRLTTLAEQNVQTHHELLQHNLTMRAYWVDRARRAIERAQVDRAAGGSRELVAIDLDVAAESRLNAGYYSKAALWAAQDYQRACEAYGDIRNLISSQG